MNYLKITIFFFIFFMLLYSVIFESFKDNPSNLDAPLRTYIGMTDQETYNDKPYLSGTKNGAVPPCTVVDTSEYGNLWNAVYGKTGGKVSQKDICVPLSYSDTNAYITCDSSNSGLPDNATCSSNLSQDCLQSINNLKTNINSFPPSFPQTDLQQYEHKCIKKCPCMNKYGDTYNGPICSPYICNYSCINNKCVQGSTGPYSNLEECQLKCSSQPADNQKYSCNVIKNVDNSIMKSPSLYNGKLSLANDNQKYSCNVIKNADNLIIQSCIVDNNGKLSLEGCQQTCSNKPSNNQISEYSDNILWSKCQSISSPINENSNNKYNDICKSILSSSKYTNRLDARECSFGQTKVGCSFTQPSKIKYIKNI